MICECCKYYKFSFTGDNCKCPDRDSCLSCTHDDVPKLVKVVGDRLQEFPLCKSCKNCIKLEKRGRLYDVDCASNPNLGGVSMNFHKCHGYRKA